MEKNELISFWMDSSDQDFKVMEDLFEKGHCTWALFVGHLVIEKLLKAYYVENIDGGGPQNLDNVLSSDSTLKERS